MSHKQIKEELEEHAPRLASFKEQLKPVVMPDGFVNSVYSNTKPKLTKERKSVNYLNPMFISGLAATLIYLLMYVYHESVQEEALSTETIERYVESNVDEYEEFITKDAVLSEDWINQALENIPENQLISYLENNLDQIDLENLIAIE